MFCCWGEEVKEKGLLVNLLKLGVHRLRLGWAAFPPPVTPYLKSLYVKSLDWFSLNDWVIPWEASSEILEMCA